MTRYVYREACHEAWTSIRYSPMFGCICPNNHMKKRCDRVFTLVNHNPCIGKCRVVSPNTKHHKHHAPSTTHQAPRTQLTCTCTFSSFPVLFSLPDSATLALPHYYERCHDSQLIESILGVRFS